MSRTTRKKGQKSFNHFYTLNHLMQDDDTDAIHPPQIDPKSEEGKKRIAIFYSDKTFKFKEPGPAWFRNVFVERPQRRKAKRQLDAYMKDTETVVILNAKDPLRYWT